MKIKLIDNLCAGRDIKNAELFNSYIGLVMLVHFSRTEYSIAALQDVPVCFGDINTTYAADQLNKHQLIRCTINDQKEITQVSLSRIYAPTQMYYYIVNNQLYAEHSNLSMMNVEELAFNNKFENPVDLPILPPSAYNYDDISYKVLFSFTNPGPLVPLHTDFSLWMLVTLQELVQEGVINSNFYGALGSEFLYLPNIGENLYLLQLMKSPIFQYTWQDKFLKWIQHKLSEYDVNINHDAENCVLDIFLSHPRESEPELFEFSYEFLMQDYSEYYGYTVDTFREQIIPALLSIKFK